MCHLAKSIFSTFFLIYIRDLLHLIPIPCHKVQDTCPPLLQTELELYLILTKHVLVLATIKMK